MKIVRFIIYVFFVTQLFNVNLFAQFEVEFNETKGTLTKNDKFKQDFGRYDGYQIPLYKGEAVNFVAYSEKFRPKMVFVSPKGKIYKQSSEEAQNIAVIITTVPEEGEWLLYVIGNAVALGEYTFQYAFASSNSLQLPQDSDFCTSLKYILAHSKAYYLLLENQFESQQSFAKLKDAKDAFIDDTDGSYSALFFETDNLKEAENIYNQLSENVVKCLDNNWTTKVIDWQKIDDYKIKSVVYTEKVKEKERFIKVFILDLRNSKQKFLNDFSVQIIINRNR